MLEDLICRGHTLSRVKGGKIALTTTKVARRILSDRALLRAYVSICGGVECIDSLQFTVRNHMVYLMTHLPPDDPVGRALRASAVRKLRVSELDMLCQEIVARYDGSALEVMEDVPPYDNDDGYMPAPQEITAEFNGKTIVLRLGEE